MTNLLRFAKLSLDLGKSKKLNGIFVLTKLKGKDKEWLLIKKRDEYADYNFKLKTILIEGLNKRLKENLPSYEAS